jgi:hypothetical protein
MGRGIARVPAPQHALDRRPCSAAKQNLTVYEKRGPWSVLRPQTSDSYMPPL